MRSEQRNHAERIRDFVLRKEMRPPGDGAGPGAQIPPGRCNRDATNHRDATKVALRANQNDNDRRSRKKEERRGREGLAAL
jgi:hypothetical protein